MTTPTPAPRSTSGLIVVGLVFLLVFFTIIVPVGGILIGSMAEHGSGSVVTSSVILFGPFILLWILPFAMAVPRARWNRRIARGRHTAYAAFQNSWYCGRCGGCFLATTSWPTLLPARKLMAPLDYRNRVWRAAGYS